MDPKSFFSAPQNSTQKQYEALRSFFISGLTAKEAADRFGYTLSTFYSLVRDFRKKLEVDPYGHFFFVSPSAGRKPKDETGEIDAMIIGLRKKYLSVVDIKTAMDVQGLEVSERYIYNLLQKEGFDRLPRRDRETARRASSACTLPAPKSFRLDGTSDAFVAQNTLGVLCLLPYLQAYGIDTIIKQSAYPHSKTINRLSSILAFVAIKLSDVRRYSADDVWCMDRGLGLFAGLNVLPKAAWYSSYSSRVTREMNRHFLKAFWCLGPIRVPVGYHQSGFYVSTLLGRRFPPGEPLVRQAQPGTVEYLSGPGSRPGFRDHYLWRYHHPAPPRR